CLGLHSNRSKLVWYPVLPDAPSLTPPKEPVVEGTPVELGCSAPSYCHTPPPTVTWTPALGLSTQLQQNDTVTSTLTFNASHLHHGNNVSCTAAYYIPSGNKTVTSTRYQLSISYAPRNTSAVGSPCLPAREGGCLNLTCTSHANPAVSEFTWYRIHGEHILKIGTGSSLSIQLWNANNVFFCEVRNDFGTEKSTVYKIDIETPPRILPSSGCSRIAAWVRCSCYSVGRPSPSLEWRLDGKLVLGSEDVSASQVNLENATLRSSLTMRAPAGLTALTCHSSNAAGNTSQELPVPHLDTQQYVTDQLPWIAATAVLAAGLLFATVCAVRAWKMANRTRLGSDALLNKAPPNQGNPQVFFKSGEDIYANIDTLMNTVGPREEPVGAGEEAAGLGEGAAGLGEGAVGLGEGAVGLGEGAVELGEGAAGPREEAVTAADSSALIQRDSEEAADPAADRQVEDCDVLYTTVNWKNN
uniref:Ig-like domain-containing protein n=1 Tax=Gadus morhua TaxID=8049 RepID=A0A8C5AMJ6_GADMO